MNKEFKNILLLGIWLALFGVVNIYMDLNGLEDTRGRAIIVYLPILVLTLTILIDKNYRIDMGYTKVFNLYIIAMFLSCLMNEVFSFSIVIPTVIGIGLLFFIFSYVKLSIDEVADLMMVIVVVGVVLVGYNLYAHGLSSFSSNYFWDSSTVYYSKDLDISIFKNKNTWGMVLVSCYIANNYCIMAYNKIKKNACMLIQVVFIISLIFSSSRAALVVCYTFQTFKYMLQLKKGMIKFLIINAGLWLVLLILVHLDMPYITNFWLRDNDITSGRLNLVSYGLEAWSKQPIFGYGIGNVDMLLKNLGFNVGSTHNNYVDYLLEGGIVYLSVNVYLLWFSLKKALRIFNTNNAIGAFHISAIIAYMVYSLAEYMKLFVPAINCIYLAFVCVYAIYLYKNSMYYKI